MLRADPHGSIDYTTHVFADHGWSELDYVLSDLRGSIRDDHHADHARVDLGPECALRRPHVHSDDPIGDVANASAGA